MYLLQKNTRHCQNTSRKYTDVSVGGCSVYVLFKHKKNINRSISFFFRSRNLLILLGRDFIMSDAKSMLMGSNLFHALEAVLNIRKTCPYDVYPLELHFYITKLEYAVVYLFFLFLLQNIDCGYS